MDFAATFWVEKWSNACGFLLRQENLKIKIAKNKFIVQAEKTQKKMGIRGKETRRDIVDAISVIEKILKKFT